MTNKFLPLLALASSIFLHNPSVGHGRTIVVTGSGDIGTDFNSNVYKTENNKVSEWSSSVSPTVELSAPGATDSISLSISPTYTYNHRREVNYFSADVGATYEKTLSPRFSFELGNNFSYSNDAATEPVVGTTLAAKFVQLDAYIQEEIVRLLFADFSWPGGQFDSTDQGHILLAQGEIQSRYNAAPATVKSQVDSLISANTISRRNSFSDTIDLNGHYTYFKDCQISFGYSFSKEKSDAAFQSDSESHNPHIDIQHKFSNELDVTASYNFIKSIYDLSDDSESHDFSIKPTYKFNYANVFSMEYSNSEISYSGVQNGNDRNTLTFDYQHKFTTKTVANLSASPYLTSIENGNNERGYDLGASLSQEFSRGLISIDANQTFAESQDVSDWQDLRRSWTARTNLQYELLKNLNSESYLSYGLRNNWALGQKSKYQDYGAGVTISYPLNRFLTGYIEYSYNQLDSDNVQTEDYQENMIVFKISASSELWRR